MKKLFACIFVFLLLPIIVVVGCNTTSDDGWVELYSITYTTDNSNTTITSECEWDRDREEIDKTEFDSAPQTQKWSGYALSEAINIDREDFITKANEKVGNTYYYSFHIGDLNNPISIFYYKVTVNNYNLNYVKVKFVSDSVLEINFKGEQKRVNTLTYDVTYFKN